MKKTAHRQSWFGIALLFTLFLVAGNFFIYQQQHDSLFSSFENSQQNVVKLLTQLARESLITENFALIEWYFNSWGKGHSEVVTLTLVNEDGFALSTYNRPTPSVRETFTSSGSITVNHDRYDLTLTSEPIVTTQLLNSLIKQLALISSIATILLGITTWFLFHKFSITPLLHEIERRRNAEHEIAKQHRLLQSVINGVHDGIMLINTDYEVELINDSAAGTEDPQLFNDQQQPIHCYEISHNRDTPCDGDDHPCPLRQVKLTGKHATTLHNHPDESGNDRFFELLASPLFDDNGKLTGIIESSREMTSHILLQHEIEEKSQHLDHLAHHDTLTSLPNRLLFLDRLEQTLLKARRNGELFALFFIDLDQFKQINDSVGHSVGDKVLIQTGKCLQQCIRADDTIARLGGDEFTIILTSVNSPDDAASVAQKVIEAIKEPMDIDGNNYHLTASI
ncbi:sensor domain-containing diguanylate cyclase [Candidatus Reidiella endopervernicosa]|uniref:Diguanylate cyclase n=1 Tax=Candidatus Reidiella endopervernicosa TaxID=2738883 RepID=A0A6N0HXM8_9GAMM|nr:sensor domain-containing diguanylate cyclase [Candidatus Reidiella endopervernicosa]QKQ27120.1 diguanylate cyclase [Candidatus Reidiella endopervernicosa]